MISKANPPAYTALAGTCAQCKRPEFIGMPLIPFGTSKPRLFHIACHAEWIVEQEAMRQFVAPVKG